MKLHLTPSLTFVTTLAVLLPTVRAASISSFDATSEGWSIVSFANLSTNDYSIVGTYAPTYSSTGGNPGGFISISDPDGGDFTFAAPAAVRSSLSGAFGTVLSYDLTHTGTINYQAGDVILEGGGLRLVWQSSPPIAPTSGWTPVSVALAPSPQWHLAATNGSLASASDFQTVLASTTGFFVRGEYTDGAEVAGIDNIIVVPEPSSLAFLALSASVVASFTRRSKSRKVA